MAKINKSLYRPLLLGGIERIYAIFLGAMFLIVIFYGNLWGRVIGSCFIFLIWSLMAYANSIDYIFFKVLIRHLQKPHAYRAHSKAQKFYYRTNFKS
jgi:type IV secretory pathway TrbD component